MKPLEKYRKNLIAEINRDLKIILDSPEESSVHNFRVGVKRLTALYYYLGSITPGLNVKKTLKPYRTLFRLFGGIRDSQIAIQLLNELEDLKQEDCKILVNILENEIKKDYKTFRSCIQDSNGKSIRVPTIHSMGISQSAILRNRNSILQNLISQVISKEARMNADKWHKKRILLKRYHHTQDAFQFYPGQTWDEEELKQIKILEQLLGDWHDRIITNHLLQSLRSHTKLAGSTASLVTQQSRFLLGSAKIYLNKFALAKGINYRISN